MEDKLRVVNEKVHGLMISKEQNKGEGQSLKSKNINITTKILFK